MSDNEYNWGKIFLEKTDDFLIDVIKQKTEIYFTLDEEKLAINELIYRGKDVNEIIKIYTERLKKKELKFEKFKNHKTSFYMFSIAFTLFFIIPFSFVGTINIILLVSLLGIIFNIVFYIFEKKDILKIRKKEEKRQYVSIHKLENFIINELNFIKIATEKVIL